VYSLYCYRRGKQSVTIVVARNGGSYGGYANRCVNLRVDDQPGLVRELRRIFRIWELTLLQHGEPSNVIEKTTITEKM